MGGKTIGAAGMVITFLLTIINAAIRRRERRIEVHPLIKFPFAWLHLLMIPAGAVVLLLGCFTGGGNPVGFLLNIGSAVLLTGIAGFPAMDLGGRKWDPSKRREWLTSFYALLILVILACVCWVQVMAG